TKPKEFVLPAFCSWASTVCDFIDWYKKDPQDEENDEINITEKPNPPFDIDTLALKPYISLPAECPANPAWQFMGGQIVLPLNIVCDGFSMASWLVMAFAWLRGLVIVG
ncbi:virulence factor TspB C-terminal domain-related protein, partial [Escherichia coli]|uniref:virulence factor TspB C-terminal domain-related protein n=1 Tax=Escherichia coli TaxID=562 RepID=UPI0031331D5F